MAYNRVFLLALFAVIITVLSGAPAPPPVPAPAPAPSRSAPAPSSSGPVPALSPSSSSSHGVGIHESCMNGYVFLLAAMLFTFLVRP